jgi:hypothetical protein
MGSCKECRYWYPAKHGRDGACARIAEVGTNPESPAWIYGPELTGSTYLETKPSFGCVLFEAKGDGLNG